LKDARVGEDSDPTISNNICLPQRGNVLQILGRYQYMPRFYLYPLLQYSTFPLLQRARSPYALYPAMDLSLLILSSVEGWVLNNLMRDLPEKALTINIWAVA
jgi:hypothetical protein